jgi:hypothetical protein
MRKAGRLCALLADCRSFRRGHGSARCRESGKPLPPRNVQLTFTSSKPMASGWLRTIERGTCVIRKRRAEAGRHERAEKRR